MRENKLKFAMYCIITSFMFILAMYLIVGIIFPEWSFSIILSLFLICIVYSKRGFPRRRRGKPPNHITI